MIKNDQAYRNLFFVAYVTSLASRRQRPMWNRYVSGLIKFNIPGYNTDDSFPARRYYKRTETPSCLCSVCCKKVTRT
jgi:hypothetical protein